MKTDTLPSLLLAACAVAVTLCSCEQDLPTYSSPDDALNFEQQVNAETGLVEERNYSFVYEGDSVMRDTIWLRANTQGFLSSSPQPFALEQVAAGTERPDAEAGRHYISFDDPSLASFYIVPAGQNTVLFPVVVLRDATLSQSDVSLYFRLKEGGAFCQGLPDQQLVMLCISDHLSRPASWSDYYFGTYGTVKHRFMIDHTGLRWDEPFISQLLDGDWGYIQYLMMLLARELDAENAARARQGLKALAEDNGKPVLFSWGASF